MTDLSFFAAPPAERHLSWGTLASIALHAALALAVLLASPLRQLVVPPPEPVAVEIVTPAEFAALTPTPAPQTLTAPTAPQSVAPHAPTTSPSQERLPKEAAPGDATITAHQFYSAGILNEPGMERIRKTMGTLADSERVVQLCNIEGLEQIRHATSVYAPDTLVPYAMADMEGSGLTLLASGGAFRSRRRWFGITFWCSVAPDYSGVTSFSFKLGNEIPKDQWEAHNLNEEDADE
jgi:hypothetical protein